MSRSSAPQARESKKKGTVSRCTACMAHAMVAMSRHRGPRREQRLRRNENVRERARTVRVAHSHGARAAHSRGHQVWQTERAASPLRHANKRVTYAREGQEVSPAPREDSGHATTVIRRQHEGQPRAEAAADCAGAYGERQRAACPATEIRDESRGSTGKKTCAEVDGAMRVAPSRVTRAEARTKGSNNKKEARTSEATGRTRTRPQGQSPSVTVAVSKSSAPRARDNNT